MDIFNYNINGSLVLLALIGVLMHTVIFERHLFPTIVDTYVKSLDSCVSPVNCNTNICNKIKSGRDSNYFMHAADDTFNKNCLFTGWELSHFIFHIFVGYFYNIYISTAISLSYEIYERIYHDCASYNDLVINFLGFLLGYFLRLHI